MAENGLALQRAAGDMRAHKGARRRDAEQAGLALQCASPGAFGRTMAQNGLALRNAAERRWNDAAGMTPLE